MRGCSSIIGQFRRSQLRSCTPPAQRRMKIKRRLKGYTYFIDALVKILVSRIVWLLCGGYPLTQVPNTLALSQPTVRGCPQRNPTICQRRKGCNILTRSVTWVYTQNLQNNPPISFFSCRSEPV
ncbi:hypothetical protein IQ07DRAFT_421699 [Pyrenochaeta sp. DS3sAY3a]|nr:hypothetical protein IQ07DRAFT_421699 [Pyrenochaeta sp. DS3sAY3a]